MNETTDFAAIWGKEIAAGGYVQVPADLLAASDLEATDKMVLAMLLSTARGLDAPTAPTVAALLHGFGKMLTPDRKCRLRTRLRKLEEGGWLRIAVLKKPMREGYVLAPCRATLMKKVGQAGGPAVVERKSNQTPNAQFQARWGDKINSRFAQYPRLLLREGHRMGLTPRLHLAAMTLLSATNAATLPVGVTTTGPGFARACGWSERAAWSALRDLRSLGLVECVGDRYGITVCVGVLVEAARRLSRQVRDEAAAAAEDTGEYDDAYFAGLDQTFGSDLMPLDEEEMERVGRQLVEGAPEQSPLRGLVADAPAASIPGGMQEESADTASAPLSMAAPDSNWDDLDALDPFGGASATDPPGDLDLDAVDPFTYAPDPPPLATANASASCKLSHDEAPALARSQAAPPPTVKAARPSVSRATAALASAPARERGVEPGRSVIRVGEPEPARSRERVPVLSYGPGETPTWCDDCGVELMDPRYTVCGPCRWKARRELGRR